MHHAAMKGHADIIQMLIDAHSEIDAQDKVFSISCLYLLVLLKNFFISKIIHFQCINLYNWLPLVKVEVEQHLVGFGNGMGCYDANNYFNCLSPWHR